jgi:hypothetical protein
MEDSTHVSKSNAPTFPKIVGFDLDDYKDCVKNVDRIDQIHAELSFLCQSRDMSEDETLLALFYHSTASSSGYVEFLRKEKFIPGGKIEGHDKPRDGDAWRELRERRDNIKNDTRTQLRVWSRKDSSTKKSLICKNLDLFLDFCIVSFNDITMSCNWCIKSNEVGWLPYTQKRYTYYHGILGGNRVKVTEDGFLLFSAQDDYDVDLHHFQFPEGVLNDIKSIKKRELFKASEDARNACWHELEDRRKSLGIQK